MRKPRIWLAAVVLVPGFGWFVYTFFKADAGFQSAILALIGTVAAGIFAHISAKRREAESRHFEAKRKGYMELINLMMDMVVSTKTNARGPSNKTLLKKMVEFKKVLLIWSDADVIKAWDRFERCAGNLSDPEATFEIWDDLLRAMRKDLGKEDSRLAKGELLALILTAEDKHMATGSKNE